MNCRVRNWVIEAEVARHENIPTSYLSIACSAISAAVNVP